MKTDGAPNAGIPVEKFQSPFAAQLAKAKEARADGQLPPEGESLPPESGDPKAPVVSQGHPFVSPSGGQQPPAAKSDTPTPTEEQSVDGPENSSAADPSAESVLFDGIERSFSDPKELAAYAKELEKKHLQLEAKFEAMKETPAPAAPGATPEAAATPDVGGSDDAGLHDIFIDPAGTVERIKAEARESMRKEIAQQKAQDAFWSEFYETYQDLKGLDDIVQLAYSKNAAVVNPLPVEKGRKLLAEEARTIVGRVREAYGQKTETLPAGPAITVGASGEGVPAVAAPKTDERPSTFIDQLNAVRAKRGQVA